MNKDKINSSEINLWGSEEFKVQETKKERKPRRKPEDSYNLSPQEESELAMYYLELTQAEGFPEIEKNLDLAKKEFTRLKTQESLPGGNTGLEIVKQYYPSIWDCNIKGHPTPREAWYDTDLMFNVIKNRLKYKGLNLTPELIRQGLSVTKKAAKVSIFRPALAKYLVNKYLRQYDTIFDPCAGFGGRLLGAVAVGKQYIGQDINSITVLETEDLIKELNLQDQASICCKDSLYDSGNYECLFTCPPYADKELWHQDIEVLDCDEWIETCLKNYNCGAYLFVVDKTEKYKDFIVETVENKSHFNSNSEKIIFIKK